MPEHSENFSKQKTQKNNQWELKTKTEIKYILEEINSRVDDVEECISYLQQGSGEHPS